MTQETVDVIVLGAGIAGLLAARRLHDAGRSVRVIDKARGVGGRMATRRIGDGTFDHGAQFFTVREPRFQEIVQTWLAEGIAAPWTTRFVGPEEPAEGDGHPRYRGVPAMTAIPKSIASGLKVDLATRAAAIRRTDAGWRIEADSAPPIQARALIATPPVPQTLALLDTAGVELPAAARMVLDQISYDPCIALMVLSDDPGQIPAPGAVRFQDGAIRWIADNRKKGVSGSPGFTIHTSPEYSAANWDQNKEEIAEDLLRLASDWLDPLAVREWQVQKWRYSRPQVTHTTRAFSVPGQFPLIFAGDAFGGPRVEGAALSGLAAADLLLNS